MSQTHAGNDQITTDTGDKFRLTLTGVVTPHCNKCGETTEARPEIDANADMNFTNHMLDTYNHSLNLDKIHTLL